MCRFDVLKSFEVLARSCAFSLFASYISLSWVGLVYDRLDGWMAWCEYFIELHE